METQIQLSESFAEKYEKYEHSVGKIMMHLEWCTKYRYKMFRKLEYQNLVSACIRRAASLHQIKIIELNVQSEHVHCIVNFEFTLSASKVLQILKGLSAKLFFEHHKKARLRYPRGHLWSRGKFASSVGFVQLDVVQNYIRTQGIHHGNRIL
ncbi:MAG: IS200/IS605 family transposase [Nanoarchaeota archaeon]|nr:IS200/IS605 family transposase [Nanoarchaeota archaeon]